MIDEVYKVLKEHGGKTLDVFINNLTKLRTGRASPSLVEGIMVDYYGTPTPLNQVASISVADSRVLVIQPWDASSIGDVEKAISSSDLGLNPQNQGKLLRIIIPEMTEERRKDMTRLIGKMTEECKIALRQNRRRAIDDIKAREKEKDISEDESHKAQKKVQTMLDEMTKKSDEIAKAKEKEIMEF